MARTITNRPTATWPFWLLLAAWLCANTPQGAIFTALTWMAEGRSFTHQQRLTQDVARLLAGEEPSTPVADAVAVATARAHWPTKLPASIPAETVAKKIELLLETTCEVLPLRIRTMHRLSSAWTCPDARRSTPPLRPPRRITA